MASFETFSEIALEDALDIAVKEIPYFEVVDNIHHLPDKNSFKVKLLDLLIQRGQVLGGTHTDTDLFEAVYKEWHKKMIEDFNPESSFNHYEAERHQAHIDARESEREVA